MLLESNEKIKSSLF